MLTSNRLNGSNRPSLKMLSRDCYLILQIPPNADLVAIRSAYRKRSKELHPDVNPDPKAAADFADLALAMETLSDPVLRLKHDDHFGYNKSIRNQDSNTKQKFSEYQTQKAASTVQEWSSDYSKAMNMRDQQRLKHIDAHRKRMKWIMFVAFATLVISILGALLLFISAV
jgi:curved DNA-binding protein CbpA